MPSTARNIVLTTLIIICASSVLASRRHSRHRSWNNHPSYIKGDKNYRPKVKITLPEHDTSHWPSNTDDCRGPEVHISPDAPAWYLYDGQFYDKSCLKTLIYLVEPEERAACRTQSHCHYARGYDNECLMRLSLDRGFDFDFEEMRRQELEWKKFVCDGKTLEQCGRNHSSWWRSRLPSSRDDCRIHGLANEKRQGGSTDNWVPWSIDPHGMLYDNDCLSRFANRLGMENPGNCTRTDTYVAHEARGVPPTELPKTLVHVTSPSGIQPHLEFPAGVTDPSLIATPVATDIPTFEDSITDSIPDPSAIDISGGWEGKRNETPQLPVRTPAKPANALPTSSPFSSRAQASAVDEWSCMWEVDVTLPDPAPEMFDATFGDTAINKTPLFTQRRVEGDLEDLSEYSNVVEEKVEGEFDRLTMGLARP
jgi:hypothetical protein